MCIVCYWPLWDRFKCFPCLPCCPYAPKATTAAKDLQKLHGWMGKLTTLNPSLRLRNAVIPSTHDSATYYINEEYLFSDAAITQRFSITGQLQQGIRLLDLRYGFYKDTNQVYSYHGPYKSKNYMEIMKEVNDFLRMNPGEFVAINLQNEKKRPTSTQARSLASQIGQMFGDIAIKSTDLYWFNLESVTLGDLAHAKRQVIFLADIDLFGAANDDSLESIVSERTTMLSHDSPTGLCSQPQACPVILLRDQLWDSKWYNTDRSSEILEENIQNINALSSRQNIMAVSQFNLTIQSSVIGIIEILTGFQPLRIDQEVREMLKDKKLQRFVRDNCELPWNYMWFDFFDYMPDTVSFLICLNSPIPLSIISAQFEGLDVTSRVCSLIKRGTTLYIIDYKKDLGVELKQGVLKLILVYGVGSQQQIAKQLSFEEGKQENALVNYMMDI